MAKVSIDVEVFQCGNCGAIILRAVGSQVPYHCWAPKDPANPLGGGSKSPTTLLGTHNLDMEKK